MLTAVKERADNLLVQVLYSCLGMQGRDFQIIISLPFMVPQACSLEHQCSWSFLADRETGPPTEKLGVLLFRKDFPKMMQITVILNFKMTSYGILKS